MDEMLTILYCTHGSEVPSVFVEKWESRGISLRTRQQVSEHRQGISGILIDQKIEQIDALNWIHTSKSLVNAEPMLILLEGKDIQYGLADQLQKELAPEQFEVLRLLLLPDGQRAMLGGNGTSNWVHFLKRKLIDEEIITLVCNRIEVDEVTASLPLYLDWKFQFYTYLGERCDRSGARLEVVSLALGMDKRVGHGWLPTEPVGDAMVKQVDKDKWLQREIGLLAENTNIKVVAIWTSQDSLRGAVPLFSSFSTVQLYLLSSLHNPNDIPSTWSTCPHPQSVLEQADLLVILDKDDKSKGISPEMFRQKMRQTLILDACSCYPLQEMEAFQLAYRTFGQKTNVWNDTAYNRV